MHPIETIVILAFLGVLAIVAFTSPRKHDANIPPFFLAGRDVSWVAIAAALVSADALTILIGCAWGRFIPAGALLAVEVLGILALLLFAPAAAVRYRRAGVSTVPEFLGRLSGDATRSLVASASLVVIIGIRVGLTLVIGRHLLRTMVTPEPSATLAAAVMIAGLSALGGGLRIIVRILGVCAALLLVGVALLPLTGAGTTGDAAPDIWSAGQNLPWLGLVVALPVYLLWYWTGDQYVLQFAFAARGEKHIWSGMRGAAAAKAAAVAAVVSAIMVLSPAQAEQHDSTGLLVAGLAEAAVLAAMVASLSGAFTSASALATLDLYRSGRPAAPGGQLVFVGRLVTVVLTIVALLWVPLARVVEPRHASYFFEALLFTTAPVAALLAIGLRGWRIPPAAARSALIAAWTLGAFRFAADLMLRDNADAGTPFSLLVRFHYLEFTSGLFCLSLAVALAGVLSYRTINEKDSYANSFTER